MKMISWNVNGLRACVDKGCFFDFLNAEQPDIMAVQETKMQPTQAAFGFDGYEAYWNSAEKRGYSGTLVLTRKTPHWVGYGIGRDEHDREGRVVTLEMDDFYFVCVYTPNSQDGLRRIDYRMDWEDAFREYLTGLARRMPVVVCGDLNVALEDYDLANPQSNHFNPGFTDQERGKLRELLKSGFSDSFRYLYPERRNAYSWWSYRMQARSRNVGWRIDYFLISDVLAPSVKDAIIYDAAMGSDHCPVGLILEDA